MGEIDEAELLSAGQRGAVLDGMADGRKRTVQADLMLWWLNLATLLGWLLSSIFVLSLARLSRST